MVARGGLGVEISTARVPIPQKRTIRTETSVGKLVITAGVPLGKSVETNLIKAEIIG